MRIAAGLATLDVDSCQLWRCRATYGHAVVLALADCKAAEHGAVSENPTTIGERATSLAIYNPSGARPRRARNRGVGGGAQRATCCRRGASARSGRRAGEL